MSKKKKRYALSASKAPDPTIGEYSLKTPEIPTALESPGGPSGTWATETKKVLVVHCEYLQRGGEDQVVLEEGRLLEKHYHLLRFIRSNEELLKVGRLTQLAKTIWNTRICKELNLFLLQHKPDIIHVHNTFPLLSPAIFRTLGRWKKRCLKHGKQVKIILTLHNFRLHCPQASLMRPLHHKGELPQSTLCHRCFIRRNFSAAIHAKCYRNSAAMTWAVALMLSLHKKLRSWQNNIDRYIYLNTVQKDLLVRVGFPQDKFVYKPNFLPGSHAVEASQSAGHPPKILELDSCLHLLFLGRLSEEKGIRLLLAAMRQLQSEYGLSRSIELKIAGNGPLHDEVLKSIARFHEEGETLPAASQIRINFCGELPHSEVQMAIQQAHFTVLPSVCYEGMPMVLLESLSQGRPVLSFRLGAYAEVLCDQETGILVPYFRNESAEVPLRKARPHTELIHNLTMALKEASIMSWERYSQMCYAAHSSFIESFTAEKNIQFLRSIYD